MTTDVSQGTPEIWTTSTIIYGYEVSSCGRVRNLKTKQIITETRPRVWFLNDPLSGKKRVITLKALVGSVSHTPKWQYYTPEDSPTGKTLIHIPTPMSTSSGLEALSFPVIIERWVDFPEGTGFGGYQLSTDLRVRNAKGGNLLQVTKRTDEPLGAYHLINLFSGDREYHLTKNLAAMVFDTFSSSALIRTAEEKVAEGTSTLQFRGEVNLESLCREHVEILKKLQTIYGEEEIWVPMDFLQGEFEISSHMQVRSNSNHSRGRLIRPRRMKDTIRVNLLDSGTGDYQAYRVHELAAKAFGLSIKSL